MSSNSFFISYFSFLFYWIVNSYDYLWFLIIYYRFLFYISSYSILFYKFSILSNIFFCSFSFQDLSVEFPVYTPIFDEFSIMILRISDFYSGSRLILFSRICREDGWLHNALNRIYKSRYNYFLFPIHN